jgi:hypothetical protein
MAEYGWVASHVKAAFGAVWSTMISSVSKAGRYFANEWGKRACVSYLQKKKNAPAPPAGGAPDGEKLPGGV